MIAEDYVSFEISQLLKEKGFDEITPLSYRLLDGFSQKITCRNSLDEGMISKVTLQMAMKWLREVHHIYIVIEPHFYLKEKASEYRFNYWIDSNYHMPYDESYPVYHPFYAKTWESYEEACEAAIKYCLENLI